MLKIVAVNAKLNSPNIASKMMENEIDFVNHDVVAVANIATIAPTAVSPK